jgi:hypothetical protein
MSENADELEKAYQDGYLSCDDIVNASDPRGARLEQVNVDRVIAEYEAQVEDDWAVVERALRADAARNARLDRLKEWAWIALAGALASLLAWLIVR